MKTDVSAYVKNIHQHRRLHHRVAAFLTALSIMMSAAVFWQLRGVGTAMTDTYYCSQQEHSHTDECYEKTLICGYDTTDNDQDGHQHTDECYEKKLICTLGEHTHSSECSSDRSADTETQEIWEKTLPQKLTDDVRENMVLVAQSQLGYTQSKTNYKVSEESGEKAHYSRYGQWYESPYCEWNSPFTYFCMYYAGVDKQTVPYGSGCMAWSAELEKKDLLRSIGKQLPQKGDVILLDSDLDGDPDTSAIVSKVSTKNEKTSVQTIQGNVGGIVAKTVYDSDDKHITGFVSLENADGTLVFEQASKSGVTVNAKAKKGTFPQGTTMTVTDISDKKAIEAAQKVIGKNKTVDDAIAVDITFKDTKGNEIEPGDSRKVQVQISLPKSKKFDEGEYSLLHVIDDNTVQKIEDASVTAEGAEFETESFSIFVLSRNNQYKEPIELYMENGRVGNNSQSNPYIIYPGERISVQYKGEYLTSGRFTVTDNDLSGGKHHINRVYGPAETNYDFLDTEKGTRTAEFNGDVPGTCRIVFIRDKNGGTGDGNIEAQLFVKVVDPIYVEAKDVGYTEASKLTMADGHVGDNSREHPYMIYVGEDLVVGYKGEYKDTQSFTVYENEYPGYNVIDITEGKTETNGDPYRVAYFTGTHAGVCRIVIENGQSTSGSEDNVASSLWVKVIDPIYVKTNYGDKGKDWIKEYLGGYDWLHDKNGYIPNTGGKPYLLRVGDKINVRSNAAGDFELETRGTTYLRKLDTPEYPGYVTYEAIAPTMTDPQNNDTSFSVRIDHKNGSVVNDSIYVRVLPDSETVAKYFTHCDMEIADDGKYTLTEFTETGKIEKVYKAYVTQINSDTILRDGNGNEVNRMPVDAYRKIGVPERTQYELTSAYYVEHYPYVGDVSLLHQPEEYQVYDGAGNPWTPSSTSGPFFDTSSHTIYRFDPNKVKSVDFNVQITLYPYEEITYTKTGDNQYINPVHSALSGEPQVIDNEQVHFEGQPLIDALNKCPLDNGLDFTFMPQGALVKLQAGKELTNKGVSANAGQFEFELRSIQYQAAKVGKVNGDGQIPENTFNITDVFPDATERDAVKAFQIIDHNTLNYNTNSFDLNSFKNAMQTALPGQDTGWISIAGLIDSCMIGSKPTNTQQIFYTAMTNSVIENAGVSSVNGKYTDLANGHYMFVNDHVEAAAKNDKDGKVSFPYLAFSEQDKGKTFTYSMSEVPDPDDPDVENYDNRVHTVTITIGEDMSVAVKYDGGDNAPVFRNTLKEYTLPNTGGPGIVPYITFGAAMMTASVVLLLRKKRREER